MNFWKQSYLFITIFTSLSLSPASSIEKRKENNNYFGTPSRRQETITTNQELLKLIANSPTGSFSDPQPRFKDDIKNIPTSVVTSFESIRSELKEFKIYTRYSLVREYLLKNGWGAKAKRKSYDMSKVFDHNYDGNPTSNRVCSITDPKKSAPILPKSGKGIDRVPRGSSNMNYMSDPKADSSLIMDECLYPETELCQYTGRIGNYMPEIWCRMKWVRKSKTYPLTEETIMLYTAKTMPKSYWTKDLNSYSNSGNSCIYITGGYERPEKGDDGTSNHCIKDLQYTFTYYRPTLPEDKIQYLYSQRKSIHTHILNMTVDQY